MRNWAAPKRETSSPSARQPGRPRWLLLVHHLPSKPSNLRVRTWRRLQQLGALPVKQAVNVLPDSPAAREDFEWLKAEIEGAGGEATVFAAHHIDAWSDEALANEFRRSRQDAYQALARDAERLLNRTRPASARRVPRAPAAGRLLKRLHQRLEAIERVDFFGGAGRDRVAAILGRLESRQKPGGPVGATAIGVAQGGAESFHGRLWVTRPRPGVDRMASAWLIRRFIDADARFDFVTDREMAGPSALPFDMFGAEFSHQGRHCTFETLCERFGLDRPATRRVGEIVHDLDLKDRRFGVREAAAIGTVIEGLQLAEADDHALLEKGISLFDALYRAFEGSQRAAGPRRVVRRRARQRARVRVQK